MSEKKQTKKNYGPAIFLTVLIIIVLLTMSILFSKFVDSHLKGHQENLQMLEQIIEVETMPDPFETFLNKNNPEDLSGVYARALFDQKTVMKLTANTRNELKRILSYQKNPVPIHIIEGTYVAYKNSVHSEVCINAAIVQRLLRNYGFADNLFKKALAPYERDDKNLLKNLWSTEKPGDMKKILEFVEQNPR